MAKNLWAENDARLGGEFVAMRLGGCREHADGIDGLVAAADAEFFTVYGVDAEGIAQALQDAPTLVAGERLLAKLAKAAGVPGERCRFL